MSVYKKSFLENIKTQKNHKNKNKKNSKKRKNKKIRKFASNKIHSELVIKTVNVRGLTEANAVLVKNKLEAKKLTKQCEDIEIDNVELKAEAFLAWIQSNANNILVLTETKLNTCSHTYHFRNVIKSQTKGNFWTFCNYLKDSKHPQQGVITLIPKHKYTKPEHTLLKVGMATKSTFAPLSNRNFEITLISYYNPNPKKNSDLLQNILEDTHHLSHLVLAGDFNEMINPNLDYKRYMGEIKQSTGKKKNKRAEKFESNIQSRNLHYATHTGSQTDTLSSQINNSIDNLYTHSSFVKKNIIFKQRIDWIFFSEDLKLFSHKFETYNSPFATDHRILSHTFLLPAKNKKKFTKPTFQIPNQFYENTFYCNKVRNYIQTLNKEEPVDSLEKAINFAIQQANAFHKENLNLRNNIRKDLLNKASQPSTTPQKKTEIKRLIDKKINFEIAQTRWKKKIERNRTNGMSKFHSSYLKKNTKLDNNLDHVEDENGNNYVKKKAADLARCFLQPLYSEEPIERESFEKLNKGNEISNESKNILNNPFTAEELLEAICYTPNKAPGPSGTKALLFKTFRKQLAPILTEIANKAMRNESVGDFLLKGNITLIPKKEDSKKVKDLRPITLLEIARKIITRAMNTRLKKCLAKEHIISGNQYCHPGRLIHENILTMKMLVERAKAKNSQLHAVFIDFEKAFDRVNHNYLLQLLKHRAFGDNFINFIQTFLKGKSRVKFQGELSEEFDIERSVPQGETISPFLFILAIDPLIRSIHNDESIKGTRTGELQVKILVYADDIVLISETKEDLAKMLQHLENYEKASNAKVSQQKSQIISFASEKIEKLGNIKHVAHNERVRHLGVFFTREGLINNLSQTMEGMVRKLTLLKNTHPNFTTRVNIWKSFAIASLLYSSEIITIENKQIIQFENLEKWFLFSNTNCDTNTFHFDSNKKYIATISLERLSLDKKNGGLSLRKIKDVFSAAKAKVLVRAKQPINKNTPCYILINQKIDEFYQQQPKTKFAHPLFVSFVKPGKYIEWNWFKQASETYYLLEKEVNYTPKPKELVWNYEEEKPIYFSNQQQIDECEEKTFCAINYDKQLDSPQIKFSLENGQFDKLAIFKADQIKWSESTTLYFVDLEKKKINLKNMFKQTINKYKKQKWTENQRKDIERGTKLSALFQKKMRCCSKIKDFRVKELMKFWTRLRFFKCSLCGEEKNSIKHILNECSITKKWEMSIDQTGEKTEIRQKSQHDPSHPNHTWSWIMNWSLWKNYWQTHFHVYQQQQLLENQIKNFENVLRDEEYNHIMFCKETSKKFNEESFKQEIQHFCFYSIENGEIIDVNQKNTSHLSFSNISNISIEDNSFESLTINSTSNKKKKKKEYSLIFDFLSEDYTSQFLSENSLLVEEDDSLLVEEEEKDYTFSMDQHEEEQHFNEIENNLHQSTESLLVTEDESENNRKIIDFSSEISFVEISHQENLQHLIVEDD